MSTLLQCAGTITISPNDTAKCNTGAFQILNPSDLLIVLSQYGVTPESILYVTSWGFGVIILMWSFGYVVGVSADLIKKI